jgi:hypothetical protein
LPDFTVSAPTFFTEGFFAAAFFTTALAAGLAGAFFNALRADGGGAALARTDGFDFATVFAAVFLDFATAFAMDSNYPRMGDDARLTPLWRVPRKPRNPAFQR